MKRVAVPKAQKAPKGKTVQFTLATEPGSEVFVAGSFNSWNPAQHRLCNNPDNGVFKLALTLPPGRHEYKFIVNGEWRLDPGCPDWLPNDQGTLNSVVSV